MTHASPTRKRVVILGASDKPERYAHQAQQLLVRHGHEVIPVHPQLKEIEGVLVVADLAQVDGPVDTVTMYVGPAISSELSGKLIALKPRRVLFNPGSENPPLSTQLQATGIGVEEACTLVLLHTGQF